ncbi:hypothetical protein Lgra_0198 [Legionella gratiana]|uniref:Ankyrin repeat protein n=1 Tax=Legionella gratiana TaxID=45066 RepID=A0A378JBZ3_9GAMM|nr:hypothetical protein [Legionella gratiana]KTD15532.1 hypothetical protein Lgra_0198 [Legionella gratiana]STX45125.1 Uncharacterised protein [Legionella gratiana]
MPTTIEILDKLKQNPKTPLTNKIEESLKEIKRICDSKYSNQSFYGNAALNRLMLLDPQIAILLTPEVLKFIFSNDPTPQTKIRRNTSSGGEINLKDAIYYGLKEGLHVIHRMPNNESQYGPSAYEEQQQKFSTNTMQIVVNISQAAGVEEIESEQKLNPNGLIEQYERIIKAVNLLKEQAQSDTLLSVPGYTPQDMRDQVGWGFQRLCQIIKTQDLEKETLDSFCEKFLNSPEAMLNGGVIHLFYDRAHIDAALEQDTVHMIGGKNYKFQDIFRAMIQKVATNPDSYPPCAKEQFCLRFGLVESDLQNRFKAIYEQVITKKEDVVSTLNVTLTQSSDEIQKNIADFENKKMEIQRQFIVNLTTLESKLKKLTHNDTPSKAEGKRLHSTLFKNQEQFFKALTSNATAKELKTTIADFRKSCKENIEIADKIMGHGWLYRIAEVLIKAVAGLFAGIGMVLGSLVGQGLAKSEHRQKFANTFFTLNQTDESRALDQFKQEILGDEKEESGLLSDSKFK